MKYLGKIALGFGIGFALEVGRRAAETLYAELSVVADDTPSLDSNRLACEELQRPGRRQAAEAGMRNEREAMVWGLKNGYIFEPNGIYVNAGPIFEQRHPKAVHTVNGHRVRLATRAELNKIYDVR